MSLALNMKSIRMDQIVNNICATLSFKTKYMIKHSVVVWLCSTNKCTFYSELLCGARGVVQIQLTLTTAGY